MRKINFKKTHSPSDQQPWRGTPQFSKAMKSFTTARTGSISEDKGVLETSKKGFIAVKRTVVLLLITTPQLLLRCNYLEKLWCITPTVWVLSISLGNSRVGKIKGVVGMVLPLQFQHSGGLKQEGPQVLRLPGLQSKTLSYNSDDEQEEKHINSCSKKNLYSR